LDIIIGYTLRQARKPYLIEAPKGISASFAILKCCKPKGIPIIVIQQRAPKMADSIARGIPVITIQNILSIREPAPPPYTTSLPKGKKHRPANLKHCIPIGIPIMVIHHNKLARSQVKPLINPPNINHKIFPKHPIMMPPNLTYYI
jgi:hypothetical protein